MMQSLASLGLTAAVTAQQWQCNKLSNNVLAGCIMSNVWTCWTHLVIIAESSFESKRTASSEQGIESVQISIANIAKTTECVHCCIWGKFATSQTFTLST